MTYSRDILTEAFENFADWCVGTSPLYECLARGVADDPDLLDLAAAVPEGRSPPHLLLASVHSLLLADVDHPISSYYRTCTDTPTDPTESDPRPAFRAFCFDHESELRTLLTTRRTQTNSVRRCTALLPAFEHVSRIVDHRPLALVELGPSAGLNLCWDRYGYDYGDSGQYGRMDSPVQIESTVHGSRSPPLPEELPPVASRVGIDMHPLDVTDMADARWLRALIWPEHTERHELLRQAITVAQEDPPGLRAGDAAETLLDVLAEIPSEHPICVFDTQLRYQLDDEGRERLQSALADAATERELHVLSGDLTAGDYEQGILLTHSTFNPNERRTELLVYQQHGEWVEWVAEE
jgi:hypothetical protein